MCAEHRCAPRGGVSYASYLSICFCLEGFSRNCCGLPSNLEMKVMTMVLFSSLPIFSFSHACSMSTTAVGMMRLHTFSGTAVYTRAVSICMQGWEDGKESGKGSLPSPSQLSYISLLKQNKTFILLPVGAHVDMYWLCSRDTCLRSNDCSDLHKISIRCMLRLISGFSPEKPLGI